MRRALGPCARTKPRRTLGQVRTYVVEPQQIFIPSLLELLQEAGLSVVRISEALDPMDVVRAHPALLFCDDDTLDEQTTRSLHFLIDSFPKLGICLYSRTQIGDARLAPSNRVLHIEKSASGEAMRSVLGDFAQAV